MTQLDADGLAQVNFLKTRPLLSKWQAYYFLRYFFSFVILQLTDGLIIPEIQLDFLLLSLALISVE